MAAKYEVVRLICSQRSKRHDKRGVKELASLAQLRAFVPNLAVIPVTICYLDRGKETILEAYLFHSKRQIYVLKAQDVTPSYRIVESRRKLYLQLGQFD